MKLSEIYREAAERIASGKEDFSCTAIAKAQGLPYNQCTEASTKYLELYELGDGFAMGKASNLHKLWSMYAQVPEARSWRVMMLLFAAAIAETEGSLPDGRDHDESATESATV